MHFLLRISVEDVQRLVMVNAIASVEIKKKEDPISINEHCGIALMVGLMKEKKTYH